MLDYSILTWYTQTFTLEKVKPHFSPIIALLCNSSISTINTPHCSSPLFYVRSTCHSPSIIEIQSDLLLLFYQIRFSEKTDELKSYRGLLTKAFHIKYAF